MRAVGSTKFACSSGLLLATTIQQQQGNFSNKFEGKGTIFQRADTVSRKCSIRLANLSSQFLLAHLAVIPSYLAVVASSYTSYTS